MSMSHHQYLTLQALKFKEAHTNASDFSNALLDEALKQPDAPVRNICALIGVPLFDEIESYCSLLNISKRKFVEMALVDFLKTVHTVIDEVKPFPDEE